MFIYIYQGCAIACLHPQDKERNGHALLHSVARHPETTEVLTRFASTAPLGLLQHPILKTSAHIQHHLSVEIVSLPLALSLLLMQVLAMMRSSMSLLLGK